MITTSKKRLKKILYGTLPYTYYRIFHPESDKILCFKFIKDYDYTAHFLHDYTLEYEHIPVSVYHDKAKELNYILHHTKKLYFPRGYTEDRIKRVYRNLLIEQDIRCPHHYVDSVEEFRGKTLLDIGGAEGLISLDAIEVVNFIYLFECEPEWIEALNATFEPWKDKIMIVKKYVSNHNDKFNQTLDDFLKDKPKENLFLKMDIEGEERNALAGSSKLFAEVKDLEFAICTYHRKDDEKVISSFLDRNNCTYKARDGYFYIRHRLRTCLVRGSKTVQ